MADTELQLLDSNTVNSNDKDESKTEHNQEQDAKPEAIDNVTAEPSLLEDVTMPSYLSVTTSTISSAKTEEFKASQDDNDLPCDNGSNGDDKSVYEVSSDDENDRQYYRNSREENKGLRGNDAKRMRYEEERRRYHSDSEEDDEDEDDDDEDDDDDDDEDDDDDDEEDYDEDLEKYKRYDRSEDEYEADKFERSSDDYVIRPSAGLDKDCKKRSASMEELSPRKRMEKNNKRQTLPTHFEDMSGHPEISLISNSRRNSAGRNYNHVTSKVKQYIQDGQEQRRLSAQRRSVEKINVDGKRLPSDNEIEEEETNTLRLNPQCKRLKEYAALTLKNMAEDPLSIVDVNIDKHVTANGNKIEAIVKDNGKNVTEGKMEIEVDDDDDDDEETSKNDKVKPVDKVNGVVEHSNDIPKENDKVFEEVEEVIDQLGNLPENNPLEILNVQTLTSEEFARTDFHEVNEGELDNLIENHIEKETNEITVDPINVVQITSQEIEGQEMGEEMAEESSTKQDYENTVRELMYQLEKKNADCAQIGQDYQNVVRENMGMKSEIENLRKALEYQQEIQRQQLQQLHHQQQVVLEQQQKLEARELKIRGQKEQIQVQQQQIIAQQQQLQEQRMLLEQEKAKNVKQVETVGIQTDDPPKTMVHSSTKTNLAPPPSNNISTSSIGLTMSSIEQWTDSVYSPVISLQPPNVDNLLNSDSATNSEKNSAQKKSNTLTSGTPTPRSSTRAMLTTTRIIETLARMTPGKLNQNGSDSEGQSKDPLISVANNCRKRKASESFGTADSGPQPFKIPNVTINDAKKFNSNSDTDAAVKSSGASQSASQGLDQKTEQYNDGDEDDVKCIIWNEDKVTKRRSCLIQAAVPPDESAKMKGKMRQCGPYLLGNVEIRISEANGTLNIWGKELTPSSSAEEDEEFDGCGAFISPGNKKSKSSMRAGISKLRSMLARTPSPVNDEESPCCSNNQRKFRKRNHNSGCNNESNHSLDRSFCCLHKGDISLGDCGFGKDHAMSEDNIHSLYDMTKKIIGRESRPTSPHTRIDSRTFCKNNSRSEEPCRHSSRRCSYSETDDIYLKECKSCHHSPTTNCSNQESTFYQDFKNSRINQCCSNFPKSETFIPPAKENPEAKKLRDTGKKVRTILEFLKSCGNPHTTSFDSSFIPETVTTAASNPSIRFNSLFPSSCSKETNSSCQKCCNSCEKRIGIASEMESELEKIRNEIAKLYSKSDEMRELLNFLRSVEN